MTPLASHARRTLHAADAVARRPAPMFIFRPKSREGKGEATEGPPQQVVKRVAPCHIFNPPPRHLVLHGRLRLPPSSVARMQGSADASGSEQPHWPAGAEFSLQLQPKQAMQPALRIGLEPGVFYLLPATEPEPPRACSYAQSAAGPRPTAPEASDNAEPLEEAEAPRGLTRTPSLEHVIAMPEMETSQTWSDTSSSVISFFTACSSPSSGSNTRDNTIELSRASTVDLTSSSAASTIELSAGGATANHLARVADKLAEVHLSPRTLSGGAADLEGGGGTGPAPSHLLGATSAAGRGCANCSDCAAGAAGAAGAATHGRRGAQLLCSVRPGGTSQFVMCDDPRNEYGVPRELGAVLIRGGQLRVIIPRVHSDRTVAQFPVHEPEDSLLARYQQGEDLAHMSVLDGTLDGPVGLTLKSLDSGLLVLQVRREAHEPDASTAYAIQYRAPLSAYQALCVALSLAANAGSRMVGVCPTP